MSRPLSGARRLVGLVLIGLVGGAVPAPAQQTYTQWLNASIEHLVAARGNQRSNAKQVEAPAATGASTALVDRTSASDLIGVALHTLGIPRSANDVETRGTAVTITPYALVSAFHAGDPLSPRRYDALPSFLRRLIFTIGYEDEVGADATDRITVYGAKIVAYGGRDAMPAAARARLLDALSRATRAFGRLSDVVADTLWARAGSALGFANEGAFRNAIANQPATFQAVLNSLGARGLAAIDAVIERELLPFLEVDTVLAELAAVQRAPQFSAGVVVRDRSLGSASYSATLMFDYGVEDRLDLSVNARFEATEGPAGRVGGGVGAQLTWQLTRPGFTGRAPATFSLAAVGEWHEEVGALAKGQMKLTIPIADGIVFPVSITAATRTELVDEAEVMGRIGITLDTARLLAGLGGR